MSDEKWVTIDVTCVSTTAMLANPMSIEQLIAISEKTTVKWPSDRPVIEQADEKAKLMMDVHGNYGFPRQWLWASLKGGGKSVETGKKARQTISKASGETLLRSFLRIDPVCTTVNNEGTQFIPFASVSSKDPDGKPYARDVRKGVGGNAAKPVAVAIIRPRFDEYTFNVRLLANTELELGRLRKVFDVAGENQGLGDNRPEKGGEFGCFAVESWVVYNNPADVPEWSGLIIPSSIEGLAESNGKVPAAV